MRHATKALVLAFDAGVMVPMLYMAKNKSHSSWKRLPDMAVSGWEAGTVVLDGKLYLAGGSPNGATPQPGMWVRIAP